MSNILANLPVFQAGFRLVNGSSLNALVAAIQSGMWVGNVYYLAPGASNASDQNTGLSPNVPLATLPGALAKCTAGNNDVVVLIGDGATTGTARLSATLDWNKNATHLIGITAPTTDAQRARIAPLTTATANINPLFKVSANGCIFANFSFFQGIGEASTDEQLALVTGDRNYFWNVDFGGMGHTNGAARAGSYIIGLDGGDENLFERCKIGLETVARSAANASVKLVSASQRNKFIDCDFEMYPTANSPLFLNANLSNGLNGSTMLFQGCSFRALLAASGGTQPSVTATWHASLNGNVCFDRCTTMAAKWAAASALVKVSGFALGNGFSSGVFANAADS